MTELDLNTIEQRTNAATQGPWEVTQRSTQYGFMSEVTAPSEATTHRHLKLVPNVADSLIRGDAEFIAAAREDVPALVAEVRQLRAARDRVLKRHFPVEVEPSDTICGECSFQLPNGRYLGKLAEFPCQTVIDLGGETP